MGYFAATRSGENPIKDIDLCPVAAKSYNRASIL